MMVEIACLYTSWECPSRRSRTQKLSNQVTTPCNLTPFTRKIVSGVLFLRTWLRKVSCRFCERSAAIVVVPFSRSRAPCRETYCQVAVPIFSSQDPDPTITSHVGGRCKHKLGARPPCRGQRGPSGPLGVAVKFRAERGCNRSWRPIADGPVIDANHGHDDLAGRGQEGLAGATGFFDRERAFLELQALGFDNVDQHGSGDAPQNSAVGWPRDDLAALGDDPRIAR